MKIAPRAVDAIYKKFEKCCLKCKKLALCIQCLENLKYKKMA